MVGSKKQTGSREEFIEKARGIFGDIYGYSKVQYVNRLTDVIIICEIHGEFTQRPASHLRGIGCSMCSRQIQTENQIDTRETFIEKAIKIHGDTYGYSKIQYVGSNIPVIIICKIHGEFQQRPNSHTQGQGCSKCAGNHQYTTIEFVEKAKGIYGDKYDYSEVEYKSAMEKIRVICPKHGLFLKTPNDFINNHSGCKDCYDYRGISQKSNREEFIERAINRHGDIYIYSLVEYINSHTFVKIICKTHGEFLQRPNNHILGQGCPTCRPRYYSKTQIQWLNFISSYNQIQIQHAENAGEYIIPSTKYSADGYCQQTNTIYEFHGDFWHGNPKKFNPTDMNTIINKTYGELYEKTIKREQEIRDMGFNLVIMWESDWNKIIKSVRTIQKIFRLFK